MDFGVFLLVFLGFVCDILVFLYVLSVFLKGFGGRGALLGRSKMQPFIENLCTKTTWATTGIRRSRGCPCISSSASPSCSNRGGPPMQPPHTSQHVSGLVWPSRPAVLQCGDRRFVGRFDRMFPGKGLQVHHIDNDSWIAHCRSLLSLAAPRCNLL